MLFKQEIKNKNWGSFAVRCLPISSIRSLQRAAVLDYQTDCHRAQVGKARTDSIYLLAWEYISLLLWIHVYSRLIHHRFLPLQKSCFSSCITMGKGEKWRYKIPVPCGFLQLRKQLQTENPEQIDGQSFSPMTCSEQHRPLHTHVAQEESPYKVHIKTSQC